MSILTLIVYSLPPLALILSLNSLTSRKAYALRLSELRSSFKVSPMTLLFTCASG